MSHLPLLECPRCAHRRVEVEMLGHLLFDHHCTVREALIALVDVRTVVMA